MTNGEKGKKAWKRYWFRYQKGINTREGRELPKGPLMTGQRDVISRNKKKTTEG